MSSKKTRKEHERKRREKLEARANIDAFRTQLEMKIRYHFPELGEDHPAVVAEMDAICAAGLAEGMIVLGKMVTGIRTEMGVNPEADKGSLIGSIVPYVLGITMENPIENGQLDSTCQRCRNQDPAASQALLRQRSPQPSGGMGEG